MALAEDTGRDGAALLAAVWADIASRWLREIPVIETLRRVWIQQYAVEDGVLRWRASEELPPAARCISSPYDLDAHYAKKRTTTWVGYVRSNVAC